jgi:hypothetical protein
MNNKNNLFFVVKIAKTVLSIICCSIFSKTMKNENTIFHLFYAWYRGRLNIAVSFSSKNFGYIRDFRWYWHFRRYGDRNKDFLPKIKKTYRLPKWHQNLNIFFQLYRMWQFGRLIFLSDVPLRRYGYFHQASGVIGQW